MNELDIFFFTWQKVHEILPTYKIKVSQSLDQLSRYWFVSHKCTFSEISSLTIISSDDNSSLNSCSCMEIIKSFLRYLTNWNTTTQRLCRDSAAKPTHHIIGPGNKMWPPFDVSNWSFTLVQNVSLVSAQKTFLIQNQLQTKHIKLKLLQLFTLYGPDQNDGKENLSKNMRNYVQEVAELQKPLFSVLISVSTFVWNLS